MAKTKLQRREWMAIIIGVVVLGTIGLYPVLSSAFEAYERSETQLRQAQYRLQEARDLRAAIERERSGQDAIMKRIEERGSFDLYSFTNRSLRELNLEERAALENRRSFTGNLEGVNLALRGVSMKELVDFLHKIYASDNLVVLQQLAYLRPSSDEKGLECEMTFVTPKV